MYSGSVGRRSGNRSGRPCAIQDVTVGSAVRPEDGFVSPGQREVADQLGPIGLYGSRYAAMVRLAFVTTGDLALAEDLVQDAFGELIGRWESVREPVAYLRQAVVSRSTSWLRRRIL